MHVIDLPDTVVGSPPEGDEGEPRPSAHLRGTGCCRRYQQDVIRNSGLDSTHRDPR